MCSGKTVIGLVLRLFFSDLLMSFSLSMKLGFPSIKVHNETSEANKMA